MVRFILTCGFCLYLTGALTQPLDSLIHSGFHLEKARALVDSGEHESAIRHLKYIDRRDTNYIQALVTLSGAYLANNQHQLAIETSGKGLAKPSAVRARLLLTQAAAYAQSNDYAKADSIYKLGAREYPFFTSFLVEHGKMWYEAGRYRDAESLFLKSLETSPYVATPHLHLGIIAMLRGEKTHGMMAMGIYLALRNQSNRQLVTLESFVKNELTDESTIEPSKSNPFARLDEIIRSRLAMESEYKTRIPIDAGVVRQFQLMFDQLAKNDYPTDNPTTKYYLPIYKRLIAESMQEPFMYHILQSTSIKVVPEWTKKNQKVLDQFYKVANSAIQQIRTTKTLDSSWGYQKPVSFHYNEDNQVESIGENDQAGEPDGLWYYYFPNGVRQAEGRYKAGKKIGSWKYYNDSGYLTAVENFDTGERLLYTERGEPWQKYTQKEAIEGEVFLYYPCGEVSEQLNYRNGQQQGVSKVLSPTGGVVEKLNYVSDTLQGPYESFYDTGEKRTIVNYKSGLMHGKYIRYHQNGKVESEGAYERGKATGAWKFYHTNGVVSEEGQYNNDEPSGVFRYYSRKGQLLEIRPYGANDKLHGQNQFFVNGKLHFELSFDSGRVVKAVYYNEAGEPAHTYTEKDGRLAGKGYMPTGELRVEFEYAEGLATGKWRYFDRWGNLESEYEYQGGKLHGKGVEYYANGKVKSVNHYENGETNGLYQSFHANGTLNTTGWYVDGKQEQLWLSYHLSGKVRTEDYFLSGVLTGESFYYNPDGSVFSRFDYVNGKIEDAVVFSAKGESELKRTGNGSSYNVVTYSRSGKELSTLGIQCGNNHGPAITRFADGRPFIENEFFNNKRNGPFKRYSTSGSLELEGYYQMGNSERIWSWYYPNGQLEVRGMFVADERDSVWVYYHENGKMSARHEFENGERHGITQFFNFGGALVMEYQYIKGDLVAWRAPGAAQWTPFNGSGVIRSKYPNGVVAFEDSFKNGQLHGSRKFFFENGVLFKEIQFQEGLDHGVNVVNYPTGKPRLRAHYAFDENHGLIEYYSPDGTLSETGQYVEGVANGTFSFFKNGKKTSETEFWYGSPIE